MNSLKTIAMICSGAIVTMIGLLLGVSVDPGTLSASQTSPVSSPAVETLSIELRGLFIEPRSVTIDDLQAFPVESVEATYISETGTEETHAFTGVRFWDALLELGIDLDPAVPEDPLDKYILLTARDGYVVVLSLGEIHPDLGAQPYLLAWEKDGKSLPEDQQPLLLVTPNDATEGRYIYGIASIEIREAESATAD